VAAKTIQIENLCNIGPKTAKWLRDIDMQTIDQLEAAGALNAYRRIKAQLPHKVSLNALWGLQAAILDLPWRELPPEIKRTLLKQFEQSDN
jgi:DNA transformation protein